MAGVLGKQMTSHALIIVLSRVLIASICLGIVIQLFTRTKLRLNNLNKTVFLAGLCLAFHWFSFFYAIKLSTVTLGLLCYACFPCFILVIESVFLRKQIKLKYLLCSLTAIAGILVAFPIQSISDSKLQGLLWGSLSAISFAVLTLLNKTSINDDSPLSVSFWQDLVATITLLPVLLFIDISLNSHEVGLMLCLGVFCTALAHWLFIESLKYKSAYQLSMIASIEPIYAIIIACLWLNESLSLNILIGGLIIILSAVYVQRKVTEAS